MVQATGKMVRLSECSSYWGFELSSDFYEEVLVKVQQEFKNSSSYRRFELSGVYCTWLKGEPQISRKERFIARYLQYGVLGDCVF